MLEIRVPISPRPHFFRQVECLYCSARACGGLSTNVRMVISVGEDREPYDIAATQPWSDANVVWRWVPREEFRRLGYQATVLDRFKVESDADVVLFADADTIFVNGVDDVIQSVKVNHAIAGVMAHIPPFLVQPDETWETIFRKLGQRLPGDRHQHTGWGTMFHRADVRFSPIYYNFGAVFVSQYIIAELAAAYQRQLVTAEVADVGYFVGQLALTLAIYELDLPRIALPPRYNFPNDPLFEVAYPQDLADIRILHYLRQDQVQRDSIWSSPEETLRFLGQRDLHVSNEVLRRTVEKLWTIEGKLADVQGATLSEASFPLSSSLLRRISRTFPRLRGSRLRNLLVAKSDRMFR